VEQERIRRYIPPFARDRAALWIFPENDQKDIGKMSFNWPQFLTTLWSLHITKPHVSLLENHQVGFDKMAGWKQHEEACWSKVDLEKASAREMTDLQFNLRIETGFATNVCLPFSVYLFFLPTAFKLLCRDWLDDEDGKTYGALISGLASKTSDENIAIWKLAKVLAKSPELTSIALADEPLDVLLQTLKASPEAGEFNTRLEGFIKEYGHRGGAERDPYHPRYRHQPHQVLVPVRSMIKLDETSSPEVKEHQNAELMRSTKDQCLKALRDAPLGFVRAPFFAWLLELVQQWMYYRDFERFYNDMTMCRPRDWLTALGRRFVSRGLIKQVDDIFFLGKEEVIWADEGKLATRDIDHRVRSRRRVYARYTNHEPPKFIRGWRFFNDEQSIEGGIGLRGIPASSGVVTGRARVCRKLDEIGKVEKGDILVTVSTDPGWTTVFSFIGGVVVETGGVIAHAVMISREYGLPCVANVTSACNLIPDGAIITVDGTNGQVVIHDQAH
jgi:phosphohistidine swiveling domain-containing protein